MSLKLVKYFLLFIFIINGVAFSEERDESTSFLFFESNWYKLNPIYNISLRAYYLETDYPHSRYLLYNSDGNFIDKGLTSYLTLEGRGELISRFFVNYNFQASTIFGVLLNKAFLQFNNGAISFGFGKENVWFGHSYHGSLLLSNNAEPYPLIKFQTVKPFRIPYIGQFNYMIFNGWPKDFKILAHRFSWMPVSWFEFGGTQTVLYKQNYKVWEFFKILSAAEENLPGIYNNEQRASLDVAFYLPFISNFPPLKNAKLYFEYAGEDIEAWWQPEDKKWVGPLGFEFYDPAHTFGLWLEANNSEFRFEYSQNYKVWNLFHKVHTGKSYQLYTKKWYKHVPFLNYGAVMGHHMGKEADDIFVELKYSWGNNRLKFIFDRERHGLASGFGSVYEVNNSPEILNQVGIEYIKLMNRISWGINFTYNDYQNISYYPNIFEVVPVSGKKASEFILGIFIGYRI